MQKKIYLSLFALGICAGSSFSQYKILGQDETSFALDFTTGHHTLSASNGYTVVNDVLTSPILEKGAPDLGKYSFSIVLPATGQPLVTVEEGAYYDVPNIYIAPSKGSLKRNVNPSDVALTYGPAYSADAFYPASRAVVNTPFIFRSVRGASIHVFPYAYNPVTHVLRVYTTLRIKVNTDKAKAGENSLNPSIGNDGAMAPVYENLFLNYKESQAPGLRYTPMGEKGRMLIITDAAYATALQPLVEWKKQRGIETEVVTTAVTGTTQSAIKSYIATYYGAHTGLTFVMLVGDHEQLPAYNAGSTGSETKWSDSYYGFISGSDHYPEVFVGRLPAKTVAHTTSMVSKIIAYEKTPSAGTWYHNSIGIGSDEGAGIGNDGEADWQHMRNIRTELLGFGYTTVHEFYDGSHGGADAAGNPNHTMVANAVETGASLFMYCGHGWLEACVTTNYSISDVNAATNYNKFPFVISVACNNGTFPGGECLTEVMMRASNTGGPTGAIAACGSSILMAWAEPMETEDEISKILTEQDASNLKHTLGGLFYNGQMKMLETYPTGTGQEVMDTWVMFGDPSTMMRSKTPQAMTVTAPACYTNNGNLIVNGGIDGADVALTQGTVILGSGTIASGSATIAIAGAGSSPATLTVSGYNQIPYTTSLPACSITGLNEVNASTLLVYPNPAEEVLYLDGGNGMQYTLTDQAGKTVANGTYTNAISISALAKGLYIVKVTGANGEMHVSRFVKK